MWWSGYIAPLFYAVGWTSVRLAGLTPTGPDPTRPVSCQVHLDPSDAATTLDLAVVLHRLGRAEAARDLYVKVGAKESAISRVIRYAPMINISTVGVCTFRESPPIRQTSYRIKLLTGC